MIPTLLQQLRTQPIRARLQAAFVLLFVLMLVVIVVSVSAMRNTLDTLTGFREEVMPELARVLELAEKVSQIAAIAPSLADSYAPETLSRDINRLQALTREIRQLSQNLPPEAGRQKKAGGERKPKPQATPYGQKPVEVTPDEVEEWLRLFKKK